MKIISAQISNKSIKGVFPYEFTYEDGTKGIYLPENVMHVEDKTKKGKFKTAQEVYESVKGIVATKPISG